MIINRAIWLAYFAIGACFLGLLVVALDAWALATAMTGYEFYCRGTLIANVPITRAPLCFALWFTEAKSWVLYVPDMLLQVQQDLSARELIRTADVALYATGAAAFGIVLVCIWATVMTRLTLSTIAGWYSLMYALSHMLIGRSGRRTA